MGTAITTTLLYADDVKLYFEIVNDSDVVTLQQSIDKFAKWAQTWQSSLSSEKCCHIRLSLLACKNPVNYHINDAALNTVDTMRDLGIYIDNKLTFVEHINLIVAKAHRHLSRSRCKYVLCLLYTSDAADE